MKTKMRKHNLLEKIRSNRDKHKRIFNEAIEGYRKKAIEELDERIEKLKAGQSVDLFISLPQPQDYTRDYNRVIAMISENLFDEIELTEAEFAQYVLDDWQWKRDFLSVSNTYTTQQYQI
jgi:hypothetical protein